MRKSSNGTKWIAKKLGCKDLAECLRHPNSERTKLLLYEITGFAVRSLRCRQDRLELQQETYRVVLGALDDGRLANPNGDAVGYVYAAARNEALSILRNQDRRASRFIPLPEGAVAQANGSSWLNQPPRNALLRSPLQLVQYRISKAVRAQQQAEPGQAEFMRGLIAGLALIRRDLLERKR